MDDPEQRWQRSPVLLWRRTARGILVRRVPSPDVVLLAGTGERLWDLLESPRTLAELVDVLVGEYLGHRDDIQRSILRALQDLAVNNVVETSGP